MSGSQHFKVQECINKSIPLSNTLAPSELMEVDEESQEITDEREDKEFEKLLWSIDDDTLFQPLGLTNHGSDAGKTVFVTWNEDYLINFVFKRSRKTRKISLTKVRLPLPSGEVVNNIFILEMNALLLMHSGRVYFFSSVKSIHSVDWINDAGGGIRCMALAPGAGFSCIRHLKAKSALMLEMYQDVPDIGRNEPILLQSCDITFDDKNYFNCSWEDERYTLISQQVTATNLEFLQYLLMEEAELSVGQWLHLFTVSCAVFALIVAGTEVKNIAENDEDLVESDYSIQQLCVYATNVDSIELDCDERRCLVFLQCGTIDIWYYSYPACGLRRMQHYTGAQYCDQVYAPSTRCFYFTDEQQVARLHFTYDVAMDSCRVEEVYKAIPGIVACTWVETQQQLICLSCNNIFYKITFESNESNNQRDLNISRSGLVTTEFENLQNLYELTPARLNRLLARAELVNELTQLPAQMHAAVEEECVKQQLLAVSTNRHLYRHLAKARLIYSVQLPTAPQQDVIMLYANNSYQLHHDSYVALMYLRIHWNDVLHSGDSLWHLYIDVDCSEGYMLHVSSELLQKQLCIVLPRKRTERQLLAEIKLKLYTLVCFENDFVAVTLPINLEINASTYAELFTNFKRCVTICNNFDIDKLIADYLKRQKKYNVNAATENEGSIVTENEKLLLHNMRLSSSCTFSNIAECLNVQIRNERLIELYFMSIAIKITYMQEEHYVTIESKDAAALYYLKIHLLYNMPALLEESVALGDSERHKLLLQLKCDLARCAATMLQSTNLDETNISDGAAGIQLSMQTQQLKQIYTKLRQEFHRLYS
ncbi:uncharacterized protein LOC101452557 [Ceratitis capitata]|uniref:(Mediterranean fruit fly) hypothetical protein n=1 Tax=Ceratitis capitata TaxID=7213 RepID=W8AGR9_CERCA|nr:uncharacterized protein LOC101452557 [Ceratitis capitata]CAD6997530.1 unnamed protein product [Ceratitis capitata]